jgi:hypothetical protein
MASIRDGTPWILLAIYIVSIGIAAGVSSESAQATVPISFLPAAIGFIFLILPLIDDISE